MTLSNTPQKARQMAQTTQEIRTIQKERQIDRTTQQKPLFKTSLSKTLTKDATSKESKPKSQRETIPIYRTTCTQDTKDATPKTKKTQNQNYQKVYKELKLFESYNTQAPTTNDERTKTDKYIKGVCIVKIQ